jgi:hypothetical protein
MGERARARNHAARDGGGALFGLVTENGLVGVTESQRPAVIVQRRIPSTGRQSVYHNVLHLDAVVLMIASSLCVVSRACSEGMEPRHARK